MSFEEVLCRLVQKKYRAVYLDGRLLTYNNKDDNEILQHLSNNEKLLVVSWFPKGPPRRRAV